MTRVSRQMEAAMQGLDPHLSLTVLAELLMATRGELYATREACRTRAAQLENQMGALTDAVAAAQSAEQDMETRVSSDEATTAAQIQQDEQSIATLQQTIADLQVQGRDVSDAQAALQSLTQRLGAFHAVTAPPADTSGGTDATGGDTSQQPAPDAGNTQPAPDAGNTQPAPDAGNTQPAPDTSGTPAPDTSGADTSGAPQPIDQSGQTIAPPPDTAQDGGQDGGQGGGAVQQ